MMVDPDGLALLILLLSGIGFAFGFFAGALQERFAWRDGQRKSLAPVAPALPATLRAVADELPTVDGMECLTYCGGGEVDYWRTSRWLSARDCWESEWNRINKGGGQAKRWITHWLPLHEISDTAKKGGEHAD